MTVVLFIDMEPHLWPQHSHDILLVIRTRCCLSTTIEEQDTNGSERKNRTITKSRGRSQTGYTLHEYSQNSSKLLLAVRHYVMG